MDWLSHWWRQSDHYDQLSSHLQARGMAPLARITIASIAASLGLVSLATIWSPLGPHGAVQLTCALAAAGGAAIASLFWALRWPSRVRAIQFAVLCNASIALAALAQSDPTAALLACTTFATIAGYIALFHTAPLMAYNFAIAAAIGAFEVVRVAPEHKVVAGLCGYAVVLILNLAVPSGIQAVVHVLGSDAVRAERDQLTGLLNRGAFHRRARAWLEQDREQLAHLVVTVIDLDRFKQVNDRYGHSTGDAALVAVASALRHSTAASAVIGRTGGEEFVIADMWHPEDVSLRAQRLCDAIAELPFGITASIGTVGVHLDGPAHHADDLLFELMVAADTAMYAAKRRGGNQTFHHRSPRSDGASLADGLGDVSDLGVYGLAGLRVPALPFDRGEVERQREREAGEEAAQEIKPRTPKASP
jgi:diguanylate cyclase (GGDEF)-like protein